MEQGDTRLAEALATWPSILTASAQRRGTTGMLLRRSARVVGFDGVTLQLEFVNRETFTVYWAKGHEEILHQALADLKLPWQAIVSVSATKSAGHE